MVFGRKKLRVMPWFRMGLGVEVAQRIFICGLMI